jgi:hypothetical protein
MTSESDQKEYRHTTLQQPALHCATNEVGLRPALHTAGESTIAAIGASSRPLRNSQVIVPAGLADRGNTSEHSFLRKRPDRQKFNPKKKRENDCWAQHNLPLRLTRSFGGRFLGVLPPRPRSSLETQRAEGVSTARHSSLPSGVPRLGQTFSHPSPGFWGSRAKSLTADPDSWPRFPIMRITGESVWVPPAQRLLTIGPTPTDRKPWLPASHESTVGPGRQIPRQRTNAWAGYNLVDSIAAARSAYPRPTL